MRRIPVTTIALVAALLAVYGLELDGDGMALCARQGFVPAHPSLGAALTSLFLHDPGSWLHVGGNALVLLLVGSLVEREIGSARFAGLFFAGGVAGCALHAVVDPSATAPLVGCSGALFAVLAVAATLYGPGMLAFVLVLAASNVVNAFERAADSVSFGAHLGGFVLGVAVVMLARLGGADLRATAAEAM